MAASGEIARKLTSSRVVGLFCATASCFLLCCSFFLLNRRVVTPPPPQRGGADEGLSRPQQQQQGGYRSQFLSQPESVSEEQKCDFSEGEWVRDELQHPLYQSTDCPFLDGGFRCTENGRPDTAYTQWRWQPRGCNLPAFSARDMLERLRNKRVVFVGDSLGRNQWESLLCMLAAAVPDKASVRELDGKPITKHMGFFRMGFQGYNLTVEYYRAPHLVAHGRKPRGVALPGTVRTTLRLDVMDWSAPRWKDADVLVFNTGHWWNYEKTVRSGCYFQVGVDDVRMNMSVEEAYRRSVETLLRWVNDEVDTARTQVVYRSYSPVHFTGGDWRRGGTCHMETLPVAQTPSDSGGGQAPAQPWADVLKTFVEAASVLSGKQRPGFRVEVLNVSEMTDRRPDGHPSLYYLGPGHPAANNRQDCSHWCLPGVPDAWNELLFALLIDRDRRAGRYAALLQEGSTLH